LVRERALLKVKETALKPTEILHTQARELTRDLDSRGGAEDPALSPDEESGDVCVIGLWVHGQRGIEVFPFPMIRVRVVGWRVRGLEG